jgi:squalene synthase HpnC
VSAYPELAAADAYCRLLAGRHYENFTVASRLLPAELRLDLARVYAYCRFTDDLGDESGERARPRLERWLSEVRHLFAGGAPVHPVLVALAATVARHRLPEQPFVDLVRANQRDQEMSAYETWPDLLGYCNLSAAPVGRIVLRLFGLAQPEAERLSDDVCIGLQLANFAQDVGVDAARGRCYLLRPEVLRLGTAGAVHVHCERARRLLASGEELERLASGRLRLQLTLYRLGGLAVLDAIERAGFETATFRPRVPARTKAALLARAVVTARRGGGHVGSMGTV